MALTDENNGGVGTTMLVSPTGNNGGFGGFGGDWSALLIIFLLCMFGGGWGMGGFGGGMMWPMMMGGFGGGFGLDYLYPWLNNSQHISDGFRDQYLNTQIGDLRTDVNRGFGDVQLGIAGVNQNICQTGNGIAGAVRDGFYGAEVAAANRQMANMQQLFGMQSQAADCCCKTQTGIADLKYTVAAENCADRQALSDGIRDVIAAQTAGVQRILDKLCDQELQAERRDNANLRSELMYARGQASQVAQTAELRTAAQTANANLLSELRSCPIPTYSVYGNVPVYTCSGNNNGCGCGCNG